MYGKLSVVCGLVFVTWNVVYSSRYVTKILRTFIKYVLWTQRTHFITSKHWLNTCVAIVLQASFQQLPSSCNKLLASVTGSSWFCSVCPDKCQISRYLQTGHDRLLPNCYQLTIHDYVVVAYFNLLALHSPGAIAIVRCHWNYTAYTC
jgi:hypothetical protein